MNREDPLHQLDDKKSLTVRALQNLLLLLFGGCAVLLADSSGIQVDGVSLLGGLPLIVIYYWTLRHRHEAHPFSVFLIGMFQDLLSGGAIGLWAFLYLLLHTMLLTQPRGLLHFIERTALFSWLGFLLASGLFTLLCWLAGWILLDSRITPLGLTLQWCVGALVYSVTLLRRPRQPATQG